MSERDIEPWNALLEGFLAISMAVWGAVLIAALANGWLTFLWWLAAVFASVLLIGAAVRGVAVWRGAHAKPGGGDG